MQKDGLTWDECAARWNLSVNAVRGRAKTLQIPIAYIDRVAHWPGEFIEFGDAFHQWRSVHPHDKVEVFLQKTGAPAGVGAKEEVNAALVKKGDAERAAELMVAGMKSMASELKALQKDDTPPPLLRAKLLAEIADNNLIVCREELKAIGVQGIPNAGLQFRQHGYDFTGYYANGVNGLRVWTCQRMVLDNKGQVSQLQSTGRTVGFVADEPTAAMFNYNQPVLPHWR